MRAASGPVRGSPADVLATLAPHSIILVRDGVVTAAQSVFLDFTATGAETVGGAGFAGAATGLGAGVALYCPTDTTIEVGDVFRFDGIQYNVEFIAPQGWGAIDGNTLRLAWAGAKRSRGV